MHIMYVMFFKEHWEIGSVAEYAWETLYLPKIKTITLKTLLALFTVLEPSNISFHKLE
jgi:hypothetical protein